LGRPSTALTNVPSSFVTDALIFSRAWATHGCAKWAVESCVAFATEFEQIAQLPIKYAHLSGERLSLLDAQGGVQRVEG
jgi:hypothetical protein